MTRRKFLEIGSRVMALSASGLFYSALSESFAENVSIISGNRPDVEILGGDGIFTNLWVDKSIFPKLKEYDIRYVFVDVGDVDKSTGKIKTPRDQIERFMNDIASFEQENNHPFTKLPWNVVIPKEGYRLDSPEFRRNYVDEYVKLVKQFDLGGIHVDIEAIPDELKKDYLEMIKDWRTKLPENSIISVYGGSLIDDGTGNAWNWSESFLQDVFKSGADMVSIPTYDTSSLTEEDYRAHINDQIRRIMRQKTGCFRYPVPMHKPAPELAEFAFGEYLKAYDKNYNWPFSGVDLFATWTMVDSDWKAYEQYRKTSKDDMYHVTRRLKCLLHNLGLEL